MLSQPQFPSLENRLQTWPALHSWDKSRISWNRKSRKDFNQETFPSGDLIRETLGEFLAPVRRGQRAAAAVASGCRGQKGTGRDDLIRCSSLECSWGGGRVPCPHRPFPPPTPQLPAPALASPRGPGVPSLPLPAQECRRWPWAPPLPTRYTVLPSGLGALSPPAT